MPMRGGRCTLKMSVDGLYKYIHNLSLTEKSAISIEKVEENYVLDFAVQNRTSGQKLLAATSSNHEIRLYQYADLANIGKLTGHEDIITGVQFAHSQDNLLFSSSCDRCIKCWDHRTGQCVQNFKAPGDVKGFSSFGVNCNDRIVAGGTECLSDDEDVHILFWDVRKTDVLGSYNESHQDDITQVRFHPDRPDSLATGSTDGLVCIFDISQQSEEDAIEFTLNAESSVAKIGWCGSTSTDLYCITHDDNLHLWDTNEGDELLVRTDIKRKMKRENKVDYMIDCVFSHELHLAMGTHRGAIRIVSLGEDPEVLASLNGGHVSTVRCLHWDTETHTLLSGAEDSFICKWDDRMKTDSKKVQLKVKKSVAKKSKKSKPY